MRKAKAARNTAVGFSKQGIHGKIRKWIRRHHGMPAERRICRRFLPGAPAPWVRVSGMEKPFLAYRNREGWNTRLQLIQLASII